jgi:hypothetical protein
MATVLGRTTERCCDAGALWNREVGKEGQLALIVSVTGPDGTGITGLTEDAFTVYVFDRFPSAPPPVIKVVPPPDFGEVSDAAGCYGMSTGSPPAGGWGDEELVIIVDVESDADHGRGFFNPIITKP